MYAKNVNCEGYRAAWLLWEAAVGVEIKNKLMVLLVMEVVLVGLVGCTRVNKWLIMCYLFILVLLVLKYIK